MRTPVLMARSPARCLTCVTRMTTEDHIAEEERQAPMVEFSGFGSEGEVYGIASTLLAPTSVRTSTA